MVCTVQLVRSQVLLLTLMWVYSTTGLLAVWDPRALCCSVGLQCASSVYHTQERCTQRWVLLYYAASGCT